MFITPLMYSNFLNEDVHVSYVFDDVLDDIIDKIIEQINSKHIDEYYTKYVYEPGIRNVLYYEDETKAIPIGYPILTKAYIDKNINSTMKVNTSITNRIVIEYNILWMDKIHLNKKLIKEQLKHEFLHVVETYVKGKVISFNTSDYNISQGSIKMFCYLINSSEINARINQAAQRLDNLSDEELVNIIKLIKQKISTDHPLLLKFKIIEELIKKLENILQLEYIKKFVIEIINTYQEKYTQDEMYLRKAKLIQICKIGHYIKKYNIISRNEEDSSMIDFLPDNEEHTNIISSRLSLEEIDSYVFNIINLLEWYINKINKRTVESLYNVIENRRNIDINEC